MIESDLAGKVGLWVKEADRPRVGSALALKVAPGDFDGLVPGLGETVQEILEDLTCLCDIVVQPLDRWEKAVGFVCLDQQLQVVVGKVDALG